MSEIMLSAIDRALAAAKARKAAKEAAGIEPEAATPKTKKVATPKVKSSKVVDASLLEARAAKAAERNDAKSKKMAQLEIDRADRRAARAVKTAARAAQQPLVVPAHLKKVERAKAKLPGLNEEMQSQFNGIVAAFDVHQLEAMAMHLQLYTRTEKTLKGRPLPIGAIVTICGGDPRYIGKTGSVLTSQKLRATVAVEGTKKPVYIYTSEAKIHS
jgi:hypothetical protein